MKSPVYEYGDTRLPLRFWNKVVVLENGCWKWTGASNSYVYGQYFHNGRNIVAHRVAYQELVGPITQKTLDHLCRNGMCVNPAHLEPVSQRVNNLRSHNVSGANARKTHCPYGHEYSESNTRHTKTRWGIQRVCIECRKAAQRKYEATHKKQISERRKQRKHEKNRLGVTP